MKKITLLLFGATILASCGKNKGEQMLYDYQQKNVSALNFDLKDLDFKIQKVEKISDIKASDSLRIIEENYLPIELWEAVADSTDAGKLEAIRFIGIGRGMQESNIEELLKIAKRYISLSKTPDVILSTKYKAVYSLKNPMLNNTKQTFDKNFYTNKEQTKFIREESTNEE